MLKTCQQCGREFNACHSWRVNCSKACNGLAKLDNPNGNLGRRKSPREACQCLGCGKEFLATEKAVAAGRGKFCSRECYHKNRAGQVRGPYGPNKPPKERICTACGKSFLTGGRANKSRHATLCSIECQRLARHRSCGAVCQSLSVAEAAYIAGIIDGEGSIMLVSRKGENSGAYLRISIANTHRGVLEWTELMTGMGRIQMIDKSKYGSPSHKTGYSWHSHGEAGETLLKQLLPYLIIKKPQAEMALAFQARLRNPAMLAEKAWQLEWMAEMKSMNKRGRKPELQSSQEAVTCVLTMPSGG